MSDTVLDTLRLPQSEIARIIAKMEPEHRHSSETHRRFRRYRMQLQRGVLTLRSCRPEGRHFTMAPRDVSADGMGLLIGCYVPSNTSCTVLLRAVDGGARRISGTIVRCRHAHGLLHEVGIRFGSRVNPEELLVSMGDDLRFSAERIDIATLAGSIVIVDGDGARAGALRSHYIGSCVDADVRNTFDSGVDGVAAGPHMALVHDPVDGRSARDFIAVVRSAGHPCPIVVYTKCPKQDHRRGLIEAGAHEVIDESGSSLMFHLAAAEFVPLREPEP